MREILFRGKRTDNGEWETGSLVIIRDGCSDKKVFLADKMTGYHTPVIPETVGQYTGLLDKKGKKIFEGDIVHAVYQVGYVGCKNVDYGIGVVKYCASYYGGASYEIDIIGDSGSRVFTASLENGVEVIGNIHDNPELIGGEEN